MTKKTRAKARRALLTLSLVLVMMMVAVGGTIAWLTDKTDSVVNTFAPTSIQIDLNEHGYTSSDNTLNTEVVKKNEDYDIIPGRNLPKDPYVTVKKGSEACWLFVEVKQSDNWPTEMTYAVDTTTSMTGTETGFEKWQTVPNETGVYYIKVLATTDDVSFNILQNKQIVVSDKMDKADMNALSTNKPTLTFTAYACQSVNVTDVTTAWNQAKGATKD